MSAKVQLQQLQAALQERGAKDVKFFLQEGHSLSKMVSDAADVLNAVIHQRCSPLPAFGDSPKKHG
jgi:hypothetical protein